MSGQLGGNGLHREPEDLDLGLRARPVGSRGLRGVRDRAYIITKQGFSRRRPPTTWSMTNLLNASLRKLETDYVDGLFIHSMEDMRPLQHEAVLESFVRLYLLPGPVFGVCSRRDCNSAMIVST